MSFEAWLKLAHIAALSVWAAGLVAMPGLLKDLGGEPTPEKGRRLRYGRFAFEVFLSPAAIVTVATGTILIFVSRPASDWLALKLVAVGGMALLHMLMARGIARRGRRIEPGPWGRSAMTVAVLACISAVLFFVLAKPPIEVALFPSWLVDGRPPDFLPGWTPSWLDVPRERDSGFPGQAPAPGLLLFVVFHRRDPETVLEDELAAVPAGEAREQQREHREHEAPGQHRLDVVAHAVHPAQAEHREERHRDHRVAPGGGAAPRAGHEHHLASPRERGEAAHDEGRRRAPERGPREERIARPPVDRVAARDPERPRDRKGDEHRMNGMTEKRDPAVEVLVGRSVLRMRGAGSLEHGASFVSRTGARIGVALLALFALGGWTGPYSTLDPAGPMAARVATLWWVMLVGATLIFALVIVLAIVPFLQSGPRRPVSQRWFLIGGGLVFPFVVLSALMVYAFWHEPVDGLAETGRPGVRVEAIARQWDWTFVYPDAEGGPVSLQNRLVVPTGHPIRLSLTSEDVIHSFWVPRLAGKRDAIPGIVNHLTINAEVPGIYGGICAEFCGVGHAFMGFDVEAVEPEAFAEALARAVAEAGDGPRSADAGERALEGETGR